MSLIKSVYQWNFISYATRAVFVDHDSFPLFWPRKSIACIKEMCPLKILSAC